MSRSSFAHTSRRFCVGLVGVSLLGSLFLLPASVEGQRRRRDTAADTPETRALALFEESATAYREGRFSDAADLLREAYGLHPEPVLLYNLARALDAEGELDDALDAYQRFLAATPDAEQAPLATRRVEVLGAQIAERDAASTPSSPVEVEEEPTPEPEVSPPPSARVPAPGPDLTGPGITLAVGGAVAIVGGILMGLASATYDSAFNEPVHLRAAQLERDAFLYRDLGAVLLGVGGAFVVGGVVWLGITLGQRGSEGSAALRIGPARLELSGTF